MTAAISESGLILGVYPDEPAKNRWGTMARHLGAQVAGNMVFEILPRVLQRAFPQWDVPGDEDQRDDEEYRLYIRKKTWRAKAAYATRAAQRDAARRSWITRPVSILWMRIQKMDVAGNALLDATFPRTNPFLATRRSLCEMLHAPPDDPPRSPVFDHSADDDNNRDALITDNRHDVMAMDPQLLHHFK